MTNMEYLTVFRYVKTVEYSILVLESPVMAVPSLSLK
jgi:hypothetical protein